MWTVRIGYSETFSVLFSEEINLFFLNNSIIQLENNKGISVNGGGNAIIQYYDKIPKITEEVRLDEHKFNVEIISNSEIDEFNFNQASKGISFEVNEKNKFVIISMEEEFLGPPYFILLNDEKIAYTKSINVENYVSLSIKPQVVGEIIISNSEYSNDLTEITSNDTLPVESISNDYFIWLVFGGILIIVVIVAIIIMKKNKK